MAAEKVFSKNKIIGGKRMSYMKRSISVFIACFMVAALGISGIIAPKAAAASKTPVAVNGQLTLKGTQLVNQNGKAVQLKESAPTVYSGMAIMSTKTR